VICLQSLLQNLTQQDDDSNLYWMAQQIVADVAAIFENAFGEPSTKSITLGFCARIRLTLLQKGNVILVRQSPEIAINQIVKMIQSNKQPLRNLLM
jgi:hypothetical protein